MAHFALSSGEPATIELGDGQRLKPGPYFVRLTQGANQRIVRTTLLD